MCNTFLEDIFKFITFIVMNTPPQRYQKTSRYIYISLFLLLLYISFFKNVFGFITFIITNPHTLVKALNILLCYFFLIIIRSQYITVN